MNSIEFSFKIKRVIFSPCLFCCQQCLWLISLIQNLRIIAAGVNFFAGMGSDIRNFGLWE